MRVPRWLWSLIPLSLWLHSGCSSPPLRQYRSLLRQVDGQRRELMVLKRQVEHLTSALNYCSDEERQLFDSVQKTCERDRMCKNPSIPLEVIKVDPYHKGRFLTLLGAHKHAIFYFPPSSSELNEPQLKRLRDLVQPTWLDDGARRTRFLIVAHPDGSAPAKAQERAQQIINTISHIAERLERAPAAAGVRHAAPEPLVEDPRTGAAATAGEPGSERGADKEELTARSKALLNEGRLLYWSFPFANSSDRAALPLADKPLQPGEQLARSVVVYRVDC